MTSARSSTRSFTVRSTRTRSSTGRAAQLACAARARATIAGTSAGSVNSGGVAVGAGSGTGVDDAFTATDSAEPSLRGPRGRGCRGAPQGTRTRQTASLRVPWPRSILQAPRAEGSDLRRRTSTAAMNNAATAPCVPRGAFPRALLHAQPFDPSVGKPPGESPTEPSPAVASRGDGEPPELASRVAVELASRSPCWPAPASPLLVAPASATPASRLAHRRAALHATRPRAIVGGRHVPRHRGALRRPQEALAHLPVAVTRHGVPASMDAPASRKPVLPPMNAREVGRGAEEAVEVDLPGNPGDGARPAPLPEHRGGPRCREVEAVGRRRVRDVERVTGARWCRWRRRRSRNRTSTPWACARSSLSPW